MIVGVIVGMISKKVGFSVDSEYDFGKNVILV